MLCMLLPNANTNWVKFPRCLHLFYRCRNQFNYNSQTSCVPWWDMTRCIDTKLKLLLMLFTSLSAQSVHCIPVIFPPLTTAFSAVYKIFALIFLDLWVIAAMIMSGSVRCILNLKFLDSNYVHVTMSRLLYHNHTHSRVDLFIDSWFWGYTHHPGSKSQSGYRLIQLLLLSPYVSYQYLPK